MKQAGRPTHGKIRPLVGIALALALAALPAWGYVGPGAGFALLSSFLVVFTTILLAIASLLIWPFRTLWRVIRKKKPPKAKIKRFIVVGFDGQDPELTDRFLAEGKLPNMKRLAEMGCYHRLKTTYPAISPVAWSSFATGTEPAKHNIFDFLDRDRRTYLPQLSSAEIGSVDKFLKIGRWRIPLRKPVIRLLRKSKPFWTLLGEHNIWSTVLRVPITFPPDRFYGAQLAAMCVPDLLGTQGTFLFFTTRSAEGEFKEGGKRIEMRREGSGGNRIETVIEGPENTFLEETPPLAIPMTLDLDPAAKTARATIGGDEHELGLMELSDWITLTFKAAPGIKVTGLCRIMLTEIDEHVSIYMTPISIDPEKPAMPVSHPGYYGTYLAKKVGPFSTLGLAEDTWALNEKITDDATFLKQTYDIDDERQAMFFGALDQLRRGTLTCVFDATDRIQHMFWRYLEEGHPAGAGRETAEHKNAIEELYKRNDEVVGRVLDELDPNDLLVVCSDHGFASFRRGINLNTWLHENGYLVLKEGTDGSAEWLRDVDWSKTRAYSIGLTGMFLNVAGREAEGIVDPKDVPALRAELVEKMSGLFDDEKDEVAITEVFETAKLYQGPYLTNAPDLIIGYNRGYRISWDGATGVVSGPVIEDNVKAWSGDHGIDPRQVPGVLLCNFPIDDDDPALIDIAPTVMTLFGFKPPAHMDGKPLFKADRTFAAATS